MYSSSQFRPAVFHMLKNHLWPVATTLSTVGLDNRFSHIQSDLQKLNSIFTFD